MLFRILCIAFFSSAFLFTSSADTGVGVANKAFAGGGTSDDNGSSKTPATTGQNNTKKATQKKAYVPDTKSLRAPRSGALFSAHRSMEKMAQKDSLEALANDYKAIRALARKYAKLNQNAKSQTDKYYAQSLYTQLNRYGGKKASKRNPQLGRNARAIRAALDAMPAESRLRQAEKDLAKAHRTKGNAGDDITAGEDYKKAYRAYQSKLKGVPPKLKAQFPKYEANPDFR